MCSCVFFPWLKPGNYLVFEVVSHFVAATDSIKFAFASCTCMRVHECACHPVKSHKKTLSERFERHFVDSSQLAERATKISVQLIMSCQTTFAGGLSHFLLQEISITKLRALTHIAGSHVPVSPVFSTCGGIIKFIGMKNVWRCRNFPPVNILMLAIFQAVDCNALYRILNYARAHTHTEIDIHTW